jgi:hypothetical protein
MDGNEDVGDEDTFSQCGEPAGSPDVVRRAGAPELVVRGWFCGEEKRNKRDRRQHEHGKGREKRPYG